jgi:hypothetical protein
MKIKLLAFGLILAASSGTSYATPGIFGFGIELDGTGATATNSGVTTLYALDNSGGSALLPAGSSATLDSTDWTGASTGAAPTFNLGTFTEGSGTLTLTGGATLTFKTASAGDDVTGADLNFRITPGVGGAGSFAPAVNLPFGANLTFDGSDPHNQLWDTESLSTNLLAGLTPGTYTLDVFGNSPNTAGGSFDSNGGANFGATFTVAAAVVPEPGTWAMMLGGLAMLVCFQRLRRKSAV